MTTFHIEIVSDVVCVWCYVGYRRLQKAIELYRKTHPGGSSDTFNITWKPYFLDEYPPATPVSKREHMIARLGPGRAASILQNTQSLGAAEGIRFAEGGVMGGTALSHTLLHLAGTIGVEQQNKVAEELFRIHFEEGKDVFSIPALVEIGVATGMERGVVEKGLNGNKAVEEVRREEREIKSRGIRGVPQYSLGGVSIQGARDAGEFFDVLLQIKEGRKK